MRDELDTVVAERFKALSQVPVPDTWTRVQTKVLDHMSADFTEEEVTMIDLEVPNHTDEARKGPKRLVAVLLAAAAVVAVALVAIRNDQLEGPADQPSSTVTVALTMPPRSLWGTPEDQILPPGTYFLDEVAGRETPRIFLTLGEGWTGSGADDPVGIVNEDLGVMTFYEPEPTYADACDTGEGYHRGTMTTLDGVVAALSEQAGWVDVTAPSDVTIDGHPGKTFRHTAPADFTGCNPGDRQFRRTANWWFEPNEVETMLVLDLNGSIILINTRLKPDKNDAEAVAGLAAVLDSIRIAEE